MPLRYLTRSLPFGCYYRVNFSTENWIGSVAADGRKSLECERKTFRQIALSIFASLQRQTAVA
jgi:hypothetical protein